MKTLANPFFIEMEKGAREAEKQLGIQLVVRTASQETSIPQQIAIMEEAVREKFDAIVLAPGDSVELIPAVAAAKAKGIVVVNIDNRLDPAFMAKSDVKDVPFISVDNREGAKLAAAVLIKGLRVPAKVLLLEGIRGAANAEERKKGAMEAMNAAPGITVVASETANWKIDEAREVTAKILQRNPDIKGIYCANDMMALGAIRALQEAGTKKVRVGGFDALPQAMDAIAAGTLFVTVDQAPADQGRLGVEYAVKLLAGESVPAETILPVRIIDSDDVNKK
jgi:ribose transport system substrate-binding protein